MQPRIVLQVPLKEPDKLPDFVEACLSEGVGLVCVVGAGCEAVHDQIDHLIWGDDPNGSRFIMTTWHDDEELEEVLEFAELGFADIDDGVELVTF